MLNGLKNHGNLILIFSDEKYFTIDPVFNQQNDWVVTFGNDISEHHRVHRVSVSKRPNSIMIIGVVASNGEKMPSV